MSGQVQDNFAFILRHFCHDQDSENLLKSSQDFNHGYGVRLLISFLSIIFDVLILKDLYYENWPYLPG